MTQYREGLAQGRHLAQRHRRERHDSQWLRSLTADRYDFLRGVGHGYVEEMGMGFLTEETA